MRSLVISICLLLPANLARGQDIRIPSDPLEGRVVFENKGCIQCHALGGYGGDVGPDLGRDHFFGSAVDLTSVLWNHIPQMNRKYRQFGLRRPSLSESEMLHLAGFLYYLRYLGHPGSVANGRRLLTEKGCTTCHTLGNGTPATTLDFYDLENDASPVRLVQSMWNHGPEMQEALAKKNVSFPYLDERDISDISAYLQMAVAHSSSVRMAPGDPNQGQNVFVYKGCIDCHSAQSTHALAGPDFGSIDLQRSVTDIAGVMWNHSPMMIEHTGREGMDWPVFEGNEMADVIAYLYFLGFQDPPGDAERGARVFEGKGCAFCHEIGGGGPATDLTTLGDLGTPVRLAQRMWNHAEEMEDLVLSKNREWPSLSRQDMMDLYAFLRRATTRERNEE
jgi:cytochrome c2